MERISTNMPNDDMQYYLRRKEEAVSDIQAKMANQTRIRQLADDPLGAAHAARFSSYLTRLERFEENTLSAKEHFNLVDGFLGEAGNILQKARELAVQGANGIYTKEDTAKIAVDVNELLKEFVSIANTSDSSGTYLFAGDRSTSEPFRFELGTVEGLGEDAPIRVEYRGSGASRRVEITDNVYSDLDIRGGDIFWAEKMRVASPLDASNYQVQRDASIFIDGVEIPLKTGDNVNSIIAKINDSPAPVRAFLDVQTRGLAMEGTDSHLISLEDQAGSDVLRQLGLIRGNSVQGATNWAPDARVSGASIFEVLINFRDALLRGDASYIGGQTLGGLDGALDNLNTRRTSYGSRNERVQTTWARLNTQIQDVNESLSREVGLDLASAAVEFGMMDMAHKASLQTAARILPQTLLDFLR